MLWFTLNIAVIPVWVKWTQYLSPMRFISGYYLQWHPVREDNGLIVWVSLADHRLINVLSLVIVFFVAWINICWAFERLFSSYLKFRDGQAQLPHMYFHQISNSGEFWKIHWSYLLILLSTLTLIIFIFDF